MHNFIEFEVIITDLCSFMYLLKPTYKTGDVTTFAEPAVYILYLFANNFASKKEYSFYYSKRPISLLFHALSHETIFFIANVL